MNSELENRLYTLESQMELVDSKGNKKKFKILIYIASILILIIFLLNYFTYTINKDILHNLDGEIYYIKRVDLVNTLYKSNASLNNETLVYEHEHEENANIMAFYYDDTNNIYTIKAMDSNSYAAVLSNRLLFVLHFKRC